MNHDQADDEVRCFKAFRDQIQERKTNRENVKSITDEIKLIYELKDIRDEIHLIRRVLEVQADVLDQLARLFWPGTTEEAKQSREDYLEHCGTKSLVNRTNRLDESALRILDGVGKQRLVAFTDDCSY